MSQVYGCPAGRAVPKAFQLPKDHNLLDLALENCNMGDPAFLYDDPAEELLFLGCNAVEA